MNFTCKSRANSASCYTLFSPRGEIVEIMEIRFLFLFYLFILLFMGSFNVHQTVQMPFPLTEITLKNLVLNSNCYIFLEGQKKKNKPFYEKISIQDDEF